MEALLNIYDERVRSNLAQQSSLSTDVLELTVLVDLLLVLDLHGKQLPRVIANSLAKIYLTK